MTQLYKQSNGAYVGDFSEDTCRIMQERYPGRYFFLDTGSETLEDSDYSEFLNRGTN